MGTRQKSTDHRCLSARLPRGRGCLPAPAARGTGGRLGLGGPGRRLLGGLLGGAGGGGALLGGPPGGGALGSRALPGGGLLGGGALLRRALLRRTRLRRALLRRTRLRRARLRRTRLRRALLGGTGLRRARPRGTRPGRARLRGRALAGSGLRAGGLLGGTPPRGGLRRPGLPLASALALSPAGGPRPVLDHPGGLRPRRLLRPRPGQPRHRSRGQRDRPLHQSGDAQHPGPRVHHGAPPAGRHRSDPVQGALGGPPDRPGARHLAQRGGSRVQRPRERLRRLLLSHDCSSSPCACLETLGTSPSAFLRVPALRALIPVKWSVLDEGSAATSGTYGSWTKSHRKTRRCHALVDETGRDNARLPRTPGSGGVLPAGHRPGTAP
ncbi:pentapeptide repeat-containing protein [Streptomyces mutabilis]|uniref:pentapeptide repeat-containing protein n=1 Tax=Streptomyces mutabilis TaxID=67332 RepID=UPI00369A9982